MSKQAPPKNNAAPPPPPPPPQEEDTEQLAWDECARPMATFVTKCLDSSSTKNEKDEECQKLYQETAYCFAPLLFPKEDQALANCWSQQNDKKAVSERCKDQIRALQTSYSQFFWGYLMTFSPGSGSACDEVTKDLQTCIEKNPNDPQKCGKLEMALQNCRATLLCPRDTKVFGDCLKLSESDRKGPRGKDCDAARDNFRVCRERVDRLTDAFQFHAASLMEGAPPAAPPPAAPKKK